MRLFSKSYDHVNVMSVLWGIDFMFMIVIFFNANRSGFVNNQEQ